MSSVAAGLLPDLDLAGVADGVGRRAFDRGRAYAARGRVLRIAWDPEASALAGSVVGQGGLYSTTAFFSAGAGRTVAFAEGECTCPVAYNCKHVAALVVAASGGRAAVPGRPDLRVLERVAEPAAWEQSLQEIVEAPARDRDGSPLAIEVALQPGGAGGRELPRLVARVMRPGARGGWINGGLAWGGLDSWYFRGDPPRADHLALLRELYAVHRAGGARSTYFSYYGGSEKLLDLGTCTARLWPLLDEAARLGLSFVHARKGLGELPPYRGGKIQLDVTSRGGEAEARAVLRLDGGDRGDGALEPLLFLGPSGHGIVCSQPGTGERPEHRRLQLVRLARPAAPALQRLLLGGEPLSIPAAELPRFAEELCPGLSRVATVVSSDGSFAPPEVSAPSLLLRVRYGDGQTAELGWEWAYRVGSGVRRVPLSIDDDPAGFRDPAAEHSILAGTVIGDPTLERFGLLDGSGRPTAVPAAVLGALDGLDLTTEALPRLETLPGIELEVEGEPPDYRDVGDSLTIGVSTADLTGERDWFGLGVTIAVEGRDVPFADVFRALAGGESRMLLGDGAHFSLLEPRLQSLRRLIEEARTLSDSPSAPLRISRYQASLWAELASLGIVTEQAQAWQRQAAALLELETLPEHAPPPALAAELRPYQREGFGWLASLWELQLGGILADDMGLGKTLEALALICHARARTPEGGPFLVVCPSSVVSTWVGEAARFAPGLAVEAVTDTLARSGRPVEQLLAADVVITTYTLLRLDADVYGAIGWDGVILDEAQAVKNHQTKTYGCVRSLSAPFKLALTGTPMENNLMELWSLLSIVAPGLFPHPARFAEQYARPIERGGDADRLDRLRRRIRPLVKRRTKELVAPELPPKQEQVVEVDLHPRHRRLYDTYLQRERQKILGLLGDFDRNRFTILRSLTLLRQLSLHAGLVDGKAEAVPCAKLAALVEHLGEVADGGHRALVFSQFTGFLAKVRACLDREGIGYCYLDGRTRQRARVIDRFRDGDDPVFLISLKAGGFGLNLTEADYCFLLDPWWNPATESQAIDRTHRIGQTRPVMVYRLIARDTIEEKVVALADRKAALFAGVMDEGDLFAGALTADDVRGLLG